VRDGTIVYILSNRGKHVKTNGHESPIEPAIARVATMAHQAVDKAAVAAEKTADRLTERTEVLRARKDKLLSETCSYVSAHPLKSVGIAVVAGLLLGRILL
jgi:ElaB/YqjD/DUF883 family membrane-anchored ribosome-binding protein